VVVPGEGSLVECVDFGEGEWCYYAWKMLVHDEAFDCDSPSVNWTNSTPPKTTSPVVIAVSSIAVLVGVAGMILAVYLILKRPVVKERIGAWRVKRMEEYNVERSKYQQRTVDPEEEGYSGGCVREA
jgi:hypothetical protein